MDGLGWYASGAGLRSVGVQRRDGPDSRRGKERILEYVTLSATQKNLSGIDFRASPKGVRRMDATNNLGQKTKLDSYFFP